MKSLTKLDSYNYFVLPGVIQVLITGNTDPILVDILSEIDRSNGKIYLEGCYYLFLGHEIYSTGGRTYLELKVVETE